MKIAGSLAAAHCALAAVALLPAAHAQDRAELERCSAIADATARLACYDAAVAAAARAPAPADAPPRADSASTPEARADQPGSGTVLRATGTLEGGQSLIAQRWELEDRYKRGLFAFTFYRPNYILPIVWSTSDLGLVLANQWSPRVGVIYDPTRKGRAKIFANYAIFYESMPLDIAHRASSDDPQIASYLPRTSADCDPRVSDPKAGGCVDLSQRMVVNGSTSPDKKWVIQGGSITPVDPDLSPQSSSEIVVGGEYDIIWSARAGVAYTRRWMNNWSRT